MDDVTDLRQTIAHEINNPLAALIANLELAMSSAATGDLARVLDELRDAAAAAARIHEQVQRTLDRPKSPPPPPRPVAAAPRRGRVLVCDDEPLISRTIRRILASAHEVTVVDDGQSALDAILAGPPFDVVLCDLMMPTMSGMDLHAALVERAPEVAARIVFMTGGAYTERAQQFLTDVPNPRLDKPFDAASLRALVAGLVG